ncbi:hypothetical protein ASE01_18290 [Nocardioides sp. Root190]|uniref:FMN-binding protein n=1 Tax=Nocardioides sp. Root190 TaxID=1736488 RepID=UPI0006F64CDC|nr:FMN-binding protein [Nocardioides sp. Root190]KRB73952.1 hypothetical protein ASE01_18290 [Nocardioides sp. Root190]
MKSSTQHPQRPQRFRLLGIAAVGVVGLGAGCTAAGSAGDGGDGGDAGGDRGSGDYTAGDYVATGRYTTPGGQEEIEVAVALAADGTISELTVTPRGVNPNSKKFQGAFATGIAEVAVGRSISSLVVDKVAGSSLSSGGFNKALDVIADAAQQ